MKTMNEEHPMWDEFIGRLKGSIKNKIKINRADEYDPLYQAEMNGWVETTELLKAYKVDINTSLKYLLDRNCFSDEMIFYNIITKPKKHKRRCQILKRFEQKPKYEKLLA